MRDSQFRKLDHRLGAMEAHSRGEALALGYRPDFTAVQNGVLRLIIENEPRTELKAVIGSYQRAVKFCRDTRTSPSLVIVMAERGRISVWEAASRLRDFADFWKGVNPSCAVREVLVLSDRDYCDSVRRQIQVLSAEFRSCCETISLEQRVAPAHPVSDKEPMVAA